VGFSWSGLNTEWIRENLYGIPVTGVAVPVVEAEFGTVVAFSAFVDIVIGAHATPTIRTSASSAMVE